jgi:hypothetical protein
MIEARFDTTVDQVENTIKPYKFDVECSEAEWKAGIIAACGALERRIKGNDSEVREIRKNVGRRRMRQALAYIEKEGKGDAPFSDDVLDLARRARMLGIQSKVFSSRLSAVRSRGCRTVKGRECCPEVYLHMLGGKLAATAAMFVDVEMLSEVYFCLPREFEKELYYGVRGDAVGVFARENKEVGRHLDGILRSEVLGDVLVLLRELKDGKKK